MADKIDIKAEFTKALDVTAFEKIKAYTLEKTTGVKSEQTIIGSRTPEQIIDAFAKVRPEWKETMDEIKKDPALLKSFHNVLKKDATMLDGFAEMAGNEGSGKANPKEMTEFLKSARNRKALGMTFDKIAESERLKFGDFKKLYDERNDQAKTLANLNDMGISTGSLMQPGDILKMVKEFLQDPKAFFDKLPEMMGMGPAQSEAFKNNGLIKFFTQATDMVLGGDGYGKPIAAGIQNIQEMVADPKTAQHYRDLTGQTDKENKQTFDRENIRARGFKSSALEGDRTNVDYKETVRPTGHFELARHGIVPEATPQQVREIAAYDAETTFKQRAPAALTL